MILNTDVSSDDTAPFRARALIADFRCGLSEAQRSDARLAVSELVTRACAEGHGPINVRLESQSSGLRASVGRVGTDFGLQADEGLSQAVVRATTDSWGLADGRSGAWFEIGTSR
jgi:hypothetical protein